ncbi:MAG: hypothetical protein JSS82_05165 [Bacteroidetes bacterium]|nr:hypothetical protein [Bacteroidota bacterium]
MKLRNLPTLIVLLFAASGAFAQHSANDNNDNFRNSRSERLYRLGKINRIRELGVHELHIGYGTPSLVNFLSDLSFNYPSGAETSISTGTAGLSYKYFLLRNFAIGITGSLEIGRGTFTANNYNNANGSFRQRLISVAPEATLLLSSRKKKMFYCALAAGYEDVLRSYSYPGSFSEQEHKSLFVANACSGVRFAFSKAFGAFIEFNIGFRGLFNCGLSLKL